MPAESPRQVGIALRWSAIAAVLALAIGTLIGALLIPPLLPASLKPVDGPGLITATERQFDDRHTLTAIPQVSAEAPVPLSGSGGTVTQFACAPGNSVAMGSRIVSINGVARIAAVTSVPLWRDLVLDTKGPDVESLQQSLQALGHELEVTGVYGWATSNAVKAVQQAAGVEATGELALGEVQWVPANAGTITSCDVSTGALLADGATLFNVGGGLTGLTLPPSAKELAEQSYLAVSGDVTVQLGEELTVTDPDLLHSVQVSAAFAEWTRDPTLGIPVEVRLAQPITTLGLPPAAVLPSSGTTGCVVNAERRTVPVRILSSELGVVFVIPEQPVTKVFAPAAKVVPDCD